MESLSSEVSILFLSSVPGVIFVVLALTRIVEGAVFSFLNIPCVDDCDDDFIVEEFEGRRAGDPIFIDDMEDEEDDDDEDDDEEDDDVAETGVLC